MGNVATLIEESRKASNGEEVSYSNHQLHRSDARSALEKLLVDLPKVERILCFNAGLKEVPPVISEFKHLSIVRIDQNKLAVFPDLPNAVEVDASSNVITSFPTAKSIKSCVLLNLARNQIAAIPSTGGELKLQALNLESNQVGALPVSLCELRGLISLNLRDNKITSVGDEIAKLPPSLKELYLGKNKIPSIPNSISVLTSLIHLDLSENALKSIPSVTSSLVDLATLDLQHNQLGPLIPNAVCSFTALTVLRLHDNKLTSLPRELKQLRALQELHAQENELTSLPAEIGSITSLRKLYLEYNKLTDLPAEIAHLKGLAVLILHHNQLKEVPAPLLALKQLLRLSLEDNPLPAEVLAAIRTHGALSLVSGLPPPEKTNSVPTLLTPEPVGSIIQRKSSEGVSVHSPRSVSPNARNPRDSGSGTASPGPVPSAVAGAAPLNYNQFKDAWEGLMTQQDFSKQRKEMLDSMSDEAKWALLNQYKGSTLELLKVAPSKGSVIKPMGKPKSAAEFVTGLRSRPTRNELNQLADHLDPSKPMHVSGFLASFIEAQGVAALLKLADSLAKRSIRNAEDDAIQLGAVKCLRIISNAALRSFLTTTGACSVMAAQLLSASNEIVRTAMAVLDSIASLHVGHSFISEALPVPQAADGSGPDPAGKFTLLLRIVGEDLANPKDGGLSLGQLALKHQAVNVINAIIEGSEELDARFTLRNQLVRAGMLEVVARLRELGANHEGLQDALDRFEEGMSHDTEEMMERLESRGSAGAQEAPFASSATPALALDPTATAGDFLRILVLSGTALKQFCVAYKADDKVSAVLHTLQTQLGPDSAALVDYQIHVVSPPIWLAADAVMSLYNLPKGETKAEYKHKPQMLRVVGPGGATITEPVSPLMNVAAVVHHLLERFLSAADSASSAVNAEEEYGLFLQAAEGKPDEGVWLNDIAKLSEYDTSKGRLVLRLKPSAVKVMFSDESFRVFHFDRAMKVRTAVDQVCDTISMKDKAADYGLLLLRNKLARVPTPVSLPAAASTGDIASEKDPGPKWMKDTKALEYYNVDAHSTLKLQLKPKTLPVHLPNGKMENLAVDLTYSPNGLIMRLFKKKSIKERSADFELHYTVAPAIKGGKAVMKRLRDAAGSVNDQLTGEVETLHIKARSKSDLPSLSATHSIAHISPVGSATPTPRDDDDASSASTSEGSATMHQSMWDEPNDDAHVTYDAGKRIEAGTLNKLIEYVTNPDNLDPEVQNIFLMTYKSFTTPTELWTKLVERYHVPESFPEKVVERIRLRVGVFMTAWLKSKHDDFGEDLRSKIHAFATSLASSPTGERLSQILLSALQMQERVAVVQLKEPPKPIIPRQLGDNLTLFDPDEVEIARQLTMKVWIPFSKLKPTEFFNSAWSKPKLAHLAPNLLAVITAFNDVGRWVATALLKQSQISGRTKMFERLIKIAQVLREQNNFHILMAVISGLSNSAVLRLKWTKDRVNSKLMKSLQALEAELGMEGSFKAYRILLNGLAQNTTTTPVIPYMGVYLTDLTFMEDGNKDTLGLKINFYKRQLVFNVIHQILRFQQVPMNFSVQPKIVQMLDNLPKLDDEELYKLSLACEPRNAQRSQIQ